MVNNRLKNIFLKSIEEKTKGHNKIALSLSSGIDSLAIAFGLQDLGKEITAYTLHIDNVESTDWKYAKRNAYIFNFPIVECIIPNTLNYMYLHRLIRTYKLYKKTDIECLYPYFYVLPKIKEDILLTGVGADNYFGLSKKAMIHYKSSLELLNEFRIKYITNKRFNMDKDLEIIAKNEYNIKIGSPYLHSPEMMEYFLDKDWDQCNKPKQKQLFLDMFPNRFSNIKIIKHTNLQCGDSQIRELFEPILKDNTTNSRNRTRVMDVYRDIHKIYHKKQKELTI